MLFLGADHAGFALKKHLLRVLKKKQIAYEDLGAFTHVANDDYPVYASEVCKKVRRTTNSRGILICGSGVGMTMAANKIAGIRAANVWNVRAGVRARQEEDANVLVLPASFVTRAQAEKILLTWLTTPFRRIPRYRRRLGELVRLEHAS
jgi:ribose 5-phosphate isomerase B